MRRQTYVKAVAMGAIAVMLMLVMTACVEQGVYDEVTLKKKTWSEKSASYVDEDGWAYRCHSQYAFSGEDMENVPSIVVMIANLRYLKGEPEFMLKGDESPAAAADMRKLAQFLGYGSGSEHKTVQEILAQDWEALEFETVNKEIIYDLIHQVFSQEVRPRGKAALSQSQGVLKEGGFTDGYQFQIGFLMDYGEVDVVMIDVLYQAGTSEGEYVQLSDIVEGGQATAEHVKLYHRLKEIEEGIEAEEDFCYGMAEYSSEMIASVDLSRLYQMLSDMKAGDYMKYWYWEIDGIYEPESAAALEQ